MGGMDILDVFISEAREIFEKLESDIVQLEENSEDSEIINRIFRYIHTLKGSSGIAGLMTVYEFSHSLENLLDDVRSGTIKVTDLMIDLILDSTDWIKDAVFNEEKIGSNELDKRKESLLTRITEFKQDKSDVLDAIDAGPAEGEKNGNTESSTPEILERYYRIIAVFREDIFESGIDPLMLMEDLLSFGTVVTKRVITDKLPSFNEINPEKCYFSWDLILRSMEPIEKLKDVFLFVDDDNEIFIEDITADFAESLAEESEEKELKIGEILVQKGALNEDQLDDVIAFQDAHKNRVGDIAVKKGYVTENEVSEALDEQTKIKKKKEISTVRVDTTKLDKILNLLGEIVIGQSSLSRIADEMDDDSGAGLKNAIYGLDRTTREFQEQIMSIRMVPIGPTFEIYRRFVRDSARSLGKEIQLVIEGGETELDKTVIEKIGDPLKHMIRNSIDHGVESPEEREAAGKDRKGKINLKSYHQEGSVFIEIIDDGKGLDLEKIRAKAEKLELVKPDEQVSKEKLFTFLFMPGFSTAERVGDLSGRGVGMDVVRTNIEKLRGSVVLTSEKNRGTIVRIKLPLTLAIIDGMLVRIGDFTYIIPLLSILESVKPEKGDVKTIEGKGEVLLVRGEYVSLLRLYKVFGIESRNKGIYDSLIVIVETGNTKVGLLVDELIGQQQIVIKSLDDFITASRAISGASILGDGSVALIIDIHGLMEDIVR